MENDTFLFVRIQQGVGFNVESEIHRFLYNKASGRLTNCSYLTNDIDEGMPFWPKFKNNNTVLIDVCQPYQIIEHLQSNMVETDKLEKFIGMANSLKESDNPVLMLVKLKN